jgi:hypothetical protein
VNNDEEEYGEVEDFSGIRQKGNDWVGSPMGVVPVRIYGNPMENFRFYMAHANFNITERMISDIEDVPGIECLDKCSRYRFRVGVGKLFVPSEVQSDVEDVLDALHDKYTWDEEIYTDEKIPNRLRREVAKQIDNFIEFYKDQSWVTLLLPNGSLDHFANSNNVAFEEKVELFRDIAREAGGAIYLSERTQQEGK